MADRDYKHLNYEPNRAPKKPTRWVLYIGLASFAALSLLLYEINANRNLATPLPPSPPANKEPTATSQETQQNRYTYFTLLKSREKLVSGGSDDPPSQNPGKTYHLQSRIFALRADAEELKKSVTELGLEAFTKTIPHEGKKQFRVFLGPYTHQQARETLRRLRLQGYAATMGEEAPD